MNRKQLIQSLGATCKNWSWSFISHNRQIVILGAWDSEREKSACGYTPRIMGIQCQEQETTGLHAGYRASELPERGG